MHSFHRSRGRILFEVFCALAISASFVGAWMQTGAWALLPAAAVALLYGVVHAFDLAGRKSAGAAESQRIDFAKNPQGDLPANRVTGAQPTAANPPLTIDNSIGEGELVEPAAPSAGDGRRAKAPRKGGGRRASAPKKAKVAELASPEETKAAVPAPPEELEVRIPPEDVVHVPLAPLFEPEPFVRQQRAVFGRKAG